MNINYLEATNDPSVVPPQMLRDYHAFFINTKPGTTYQWAGGTLEHLDTGGRSDGELQAMFTDLVGNQVSMTYYSNLSQLARQNPYIARQWKDQYGFDPGAAAA